MNNPYPNRKPYYSPQHNAWNEGYEAAHRVVTETLAIGSLSDRIAAHACRLVLRGILEEALRQPEEQSESAADQHMSLEELKQCYPAADWIECPDCGVAMDSFYLKAHKKDSCIGKPEAQSEERHD